MEYTGFILPNCHIPCKRCHKLKISFFYTYKSFLADLNVQYINFSLSLSIISPQCSLSFIVVKDLYLTCITLLSVSFSLHSCIHVLYEQIKNVVVDVSWEDMTRKKIQSSVQNFKFCNATSKELHKNIFSHFFK